MNAGQWLAFTLFLNMGDPETGIWSSTQNKETHTWRNQKSLYEVHDVFPYKFPPLALLKYDNGNLFNTCEKRDASRITTIKKISAKSGIQYIHFQLVVT